MVLTSACRRRAACDSDMQPALIPPNETLADFAGICSRDMVAATRAQNRYGEMRMSKDRLCAIVTGSASGLGAATAAILAKGGARVVVNYSSSQKEAEQTADLCRSAGGEVVVVQGDVSRDEDCKKIVAAAAPWGRLDALINNAGTTKHMAHDNLDGLSAEDFQRLFGVNTIGPFQMVRAARSLLEAGAKAAGGGLAGGDRGVGGGTHGARLSMRFCA